MKLSDKIVGLRKSNEMSQEDLAEKLDVSRQAISRWESGAAMPDANNILQLSKLFGVTKGAMSQRVNTILRKMRNMYLEE